MPKRSIRALIASAALLTAAGLALADWPQWRGANRDARTQLTVPQTWPKELKAKWKQTVGTGDGTPALVGDKLYAFSRQDDNEVTSCLDANTGKIIWQDKYPAVQVSGPDSAHPGPRSSPTVAEGKVVTFGVGGVLSCLDAQSGKVVWRKESTKDFSLDVPRFHTAMSPLVAEGMCIAHLGGNGKGAIIAFDLNTGNPKWKWEGDSPGYASPVLAMIGGIQQVVEMGDQSIVGLSLDDGKLLWQTPTSGGMARGAGGAGGPGAGPGGPGAGTGGPGGGRGPGMRGGGRGMGGGMSYPTGTPIVDGDTIYVTSRSGTRALNIEKQGDAFAAKELWSNPDAGTAFNTPVLKDGMLYGLSGSDNLFCINAKTGETVGTRSVAAGGAAPGAPGGAGQGGGGRGRGMGRMQAGFGSIVDAGSVLLALTPSQELIVLKPGDKELNAVAKIKVADSPTYAYPIASGNHLYIKDKDDVIAYSVE